MEILLEMIFNMKWTDEEVRILKSNYQTKGRNIPELLKRHTKSGIEMKARRLGIPLTHELFKKTNITPEMHAVIDGLLLGDGGITTTNGKTARLCVTQSEISLSWLYSLKEFFEKNNLQCGKISPQHKGEERYIKGVKTKPKPTFQFRTLKYVDLIRYHTRWYPNKTKHVPRDVDLSPLSLAQWHMGDGSFNNRGKYSTICLSTDSFDTMSIDFLIDKLYTLYGWHFKRYPKKDKFTMTLYGIKKVSDFLNVIKPYKVSCFDYKWIKSDIQNGTIQTKF